MSQGKTSMICGKMMVFMTHLLLLLGVLRIDRVYSILQKEKVPIDINLSGQRPARITTIPSAKFFGGINYIIQHSRRHTHILGAVYDKEELIIEGSPMSVSRYVLHVIREDDSRYLRIITRNRSTGAHVSTVNEYVKGHGDSGYRRLNRIPMDIDLLSQESSQYICVDFVTDWKTIDGNIESLRDLDGIPENLELIPMRYRIQKEVQDDFVLGRVKYGQYLVEDLTEGLISKEIIWEGGIEHPRIMTISRYTNWSEVVINYRFISGEFDKFYVRDSKRTFIDLRG
ncbi:hypothetical protein BEWA_028310 [Theileria equi strain WA]|uniref:Signal peptide containing protein n=1 Tax=Theileria equi strain WA TaxID=1537102 RepID=L0AWL7_THEEQ|nr:hypothetical protein BEWA_028310 [Theileria equi strain WA]AFZ79982.1 hypothetical protein BEWA_028310 [Theileria equi strain WA]|eukprot:XP_004829648.1 hypothetical protein BEWA_028310 [Theileria equi strain WA]